MSEYLGPLQLRDPKRAFGILEREVLFFGSQKRCAVCDSEVPWNEAEVHHVVEHSKGGLTSLSNAALVHSACHPKGEAATGSFAAKFHTAKSNKSVRPKVRYNDDALGYLWKNRESRLFLPNGTEIRMSYKGKEYFAKVDGDQITYNGKNHSPSTLVNTITQTSRNAWRDLWIKFPGDSDWKAANDLRSDAPPVETF
jgi:hypothetical protein